MTRREFARLSALGLVGAATMGGQRINVRRMARPKSAPSGPSNLLTAADFSYRGIFRMPPTTPFQNPLSFSNGMITGRYRDGNRLQVIVSGPNFQTGDVNTTVGAMELVVPALNTLTSDIATAPIPAIVRSWPRSALYGPNSQNLEGVPSDGPTGYASSFLYTGNDFGLGTQLWWSNHSQYSGGPHVSNIGFAVLNDDGTASSYGPWGTDVHSGAATAMLMALPAWFRAAAGVGPLGIGGGTYSGFAPGNFGAGNLHAFSGTQPGTATPRNFFNPDGGGLVDGHGNAWAVPTKPCVFYPLSLPMACQTAFVTCGPNIPNNPYPACAGDSTFAVAPQHWDNASSSLWRIDAGLWIEGQTKRGVVYFGSHPDTISIANGYPYNRDYGGADPTRCHSWYNASHVCCEGQDAWGSNNGNARLWLATGPGCASMTAFFWIYDPTDFVDVAKNLANSFDVLPKTRAGGIRCATLGMPTSGIMNVDEAVAFNVWGGAWFDPISKLLFLTQVGVDNPDCCNPVPVVHVFSVNC